MAVAVHAGVATDDPWIRGIYTGESPRPQAAEAGHAWRKASALAERTDRAFVLVGSGDSMRPLYRAGTILVLRQIPYGRLRRGQTVLYRTEQRKVVAHVLVARTRDGWRARGLNNPQHDMEPVQPDNYVGVVIAAYQPTVPVAGMRLASASSPPQGLAGRSPGEDLE
jgi:signal peptidase I